MAEMRVYKKSRRHRRWYIEFRDHAGIYRRLSSGMRDRSLALWMGKNLERLVGARESNANIPPDLVEWMEGPMPDRIRDQLVTWGILDRARVSQGQDVGIHLQAWHDDLIARGRSEEYARKSQWRLERLFGATRTETYADIDEAIIAAQLKRWRQIPRRQDGGISAATSDHYIVALKAFCQWMKDKRRATEHRAELLTKLSDRKNLKKQRRALSLEEQRQLIAVVATTADRWNSTGAQRSMVYQLAIETGLRAEAIRNLTRENFHLDGRQPYVQAFDKGDKLRTLPLSPGLVGLLRPHLKRKVARARAFDLPNLGNMARMITWDIRRARWAWWRAAPTPAKRRERAGSEFLQSPNSVGQEIDFHCLRHTCATNHVRAGTPPQVLKDIMGHSDINTTMRYYTHLTLEDSAAAAARLPSLTPAKPAKKKGKTA